MAGTSEDRRGTQPREPGSSWLPYVPRHVVEEIIRRHPADVLAREHRFRAATMFADISGFTAMSEALAREGQRGTEELTDLLNDYFGTMIELVASYGGSVTKFGGDAIVVLFMSEGREGAAVRRAATCALVMQEAMPRYRALPTSAGAFDLEFKAGLGHGELLSTTVGHPQVRREHVVAGPAIEACVDAEHQASAGQVVLHPSASSLLPDGTLTPLGRGYTLLSDLHPRGRRTPLRDLARMPDDVSEHLAAYLHPAIAERIRTGQERFVDEHRRVSALFAGFEQADSDLEDPLRLQSFLSPLLGVIGRLDGHLMQIDIGDKGRKAMALFGAPVAHEDDDDRALRCAVQIRDLVPAGDVRIGVASGSVFCGDIGGRTRREYTAIGDTINLAARLMQAAPPGAIIATRIPPRVLAGFDAEPRDPIAVKGKSDLAATVSILGVTLAGTPERAHLDDAPMLGRRNELRRITRRLDAASSGRGCTIAIVGEAGVGKSRFVAAAQGKADKRSFSCHEGVCQSHGERTPYLPWRGLLRSLLDLDASLPAADEIELLRSRLEEIGPGVVARIPLLGPALNLPVPDNERTAGLDPELRAELLSTLIGDLVHDRAGRGPLLLTIDDVQWIDPASRELLSSVARSIERLPVALILVSRTDDGITQPSWLRSLPEITRIALDGLGDADARRLAERTIAATFDAAAPEEVLDLLVERSDGNPFYLEETVYLLHDRDIGLADLDRIREIALPDTLGSLVLARIDTLTPEETTTLKAASAIGRRFPKTWLSGSFPDLGTPEQTRARLDRLRSVGLLQEAGRDEIEFRHAVVRDAAYGTLTIALRRDLHERIGRFVETTYANELDGFVDVLAYHFGESRDLERQRTWFRRAADRARAAFSNDAARSWLERLVPLSKGSQQARVLCDLGEIQQLVGNWPEAEHSFQAGLEAAQTVSDRLEVARCRSRLGYLHVYTGSFDDARGELVEAQQQFVASGDSAGLLTVLEYLAFVTAQAADHRASLGYSQQQLALATETGDEIAECTATEQIGLVLSRTGDDDGALKHLTRALAIAERHGYVRGVILAANDLAGLYAERGDHARAFPYVKDAFDAAREIGDRHAAAVLTLNAAEIYRQHADPERALLYAAAAVEAMRELGDWADLASGVANIASALTEAGRSSEARTFSELAVSLARPLEDSYLLADCLHELATIVWGDGDPSTALRMNEEALAIATQIDWPDVRLRAQILAVELAAATGGLENDDALLQLGRLADPHGRPTERAAVDRARARFGDRDARGRAADLYRDLWAKTWNAEYASALEELTGERPPAPSPLPSLDEGLTADDLDRVLRVARDVLVRISEDAEVA